MSTAGQGTNYRLISFFLYISFQCIFRFVLPNNGEKMNIFTNQHGRQAQRQEEGFNTIYTWYSIPVFIISSLLSSVLST